MKAIVINQNGGPEQLVYQDHAEPAPKEGEAVVRLEAIGVNYIDTYHRTGLYKTALPLIPGMEGAGTVERIASGVTEVKPGDRVAWAMQLGAYAEYASVPAWRLVPIPAGIDSKRAASLMLQGMTAHYLTHSTYPLGSRDTCLVHAAAGGAGLLITQLAKKRGARVIGTVSTDEKAEQARKAGADEIIIYTRQDFEDEIRTLTSGRGVDVVYDSVGATTFAKSLNCLRPRGMLVLFGQSSGPVPPFDLGQLNAKGSLYITRPSLGHYNLTRDEVLVRASEVLNANLDLRIDREYPLGEAAQAHRDLESRKTSGKLLLIP